MIEILLATNSTAVPVDPFSVTVPIYFIGGLITALVLGISLPFIAIILRKDPTIVWRAQHKSWSYDVMLSSSDDIKLLPIMEEDIDPLTNTFDFGDKKEKGSVGTYHLQDKDDKDRKTKFTHKGHPAYIHVHNQTEPQAFVPNASFEASISPVNVYKAKDGMVREQIDSIRVKDAIPKTSLAIILLAIIVIILGVAVYGEASSIMTFLQNHFGSTTPSNSTATQCPTGYALNTRGVCVPQVPYQMFLGLTLPSIGFTPKSWRKALGLSKSKAWMLTVLSIALIPFLAVGVNMMILLNQSPSVYIPQIYGNGGDFSVAEIVVGTVLFLSAWRIGTRLIDRDGLDRKTRRMMLKLNRRHAEFWRLVEAE